LVLSILSGLVDLLVALQTNGRLGDRGSTVVKSQCYKSEVASSIPPGIIGNFH